MTIGDAARWAMRAPAERATLPAAAVTWTAAEILHAAQFPGIDAGLASLAVAGVTYGAGHGRKHARQAAAGITLTGAWLAAATEAGPLAWPWHGLSLLWAGGSLGGYWWLRRHEAVRKARGWRQARENWLSVLAPAYGLHGSHLLDWERTRLGEAFIADITGTGKRASMHVIGDLAERIAERERLPASRVQVTAAGVAGRIRVSIRRIDPWAVPPVHPVLDDEPELALPVPCTVREPLVVGIDPETGKPLLLIVWDSDGSKNILLVGKKGAGKTALLSCIRERLTAASDALVFDINVSKAQEDAEWAPACHLTAAGRGQRKRALHILRCAHAAILHRSEIPRDTGNFQPSPEAPLIVVIIDEIDALVKGSDYIAQAIRSELAYLASKDRSEAVGLILAGQRGTAEWVGGSDVRSQMDITGLGKVSRRGEMHHAAGDMGLTLPDMSAYGEGHPGVWVIAEDGGSHQAGRTFKLTEPPDIRRIAAARAAHLGAAYAALRGRQPAPRLVSPHTAAQAANTEEPDHSPVTTLDPLSGLDDGLLEDSLPDELRDRLRKIDDRNADTRRILAESDAIIAGLPHADKAKLAEATRQRWDEGAGATVIPPEVREKLIMLLGGEGMSGRKITEAFPGQTRWQMMIFLNRLRWEGIARVEGKGRAARWVACAGSAGAP